MSVIGLALESAKELWFVALGAGAASAVTIAGFGSGEQPRAVQPGPELQVVVPAGGHVEVGEEQCEGGGDGYFAEVAVSQRDGRPLGEPSTSSDGTVDTWRALGGRITWDGVTFRNTSSGAVTVAAWCG